WGSLGNGKLDNQYEPIEITDSLLFNPHFVPCQVQPDVSSAAALGFKYGTISRQLPGIQYSQQEQQQLGKQIYNKQGVVIKPQVNIPPLKVSLYPPQQTKGNKLFSYVKSFFTQLTTGSGLLNNPAHYQLQQNSISDAKGQFGVFGTHCIVGCAAGNIHSLFVSDVGVVFASGDNLGVGEDPLGQLGFDPRVVPRLLQPSPLLPALFDGKLIARVACGQFHSLALTTDGEVYIWGSNTHYQLNPAIFHQQILTDPYDTSYLSTAAALSITHTHIPLLVPKTMFRGDSV
ncbi:MAG: hypothetical protein EZS28_046268, partial [Streblomastix strix]